MDDRVRSRCDSPGTTVLSTVVAAKKCIVGIEHAEYRYFVLVKSQSRNGVKLVGLFQSGVDWTDLGAVK